MIKISQAQVLEFLQKHPKKWFTAKEISERIRISIGSCTSNIYRLMKHRQIIRRESGKRYSFEYKYKGKDEEY